MRRSVWRWPLFRNPRNPAALDKSALVVTPMCAPGASPCRPLCDHRQRWDRQAGPSGPPVRRSYVSSRASLRQCRWHGQSSHPHCVHWLPAIAPQHPPAQSAGRRNRRRPWQSNGHGQLSYPNLHVRPDRELNFVVVLGALCKRLGDATDRGCFAYRAVVVRRMIPSDVVCSRDRTKIWGHPTDAVQ